MTSRFLLPVVACGCLVSGLAIGFSLRPEPEIAPQSAGKNHTAEFAAGKKSEVEVRRVDPVIPAVAEWTPPVSESERPPTRAPRRQNPVFHEVPESPARQARASLQTTAPISHDPESAAGRAPSGAVPGPARSLAILSTDGQGEMQIVVPLGARLPAAIADQSEAVTAQQAEALDTIAEEFIGSTEDAPQQSSSGNDERVVWDAAREVADEHYRTIFGQQAYIQYNLSTAREALSEPSP